MCVCASVSDRDREESTVGSRRPGDSFIQMFLSVIFYIVSGPVLCVVSPAKVSLPLYKLVKGRRRKS